jgi:A/G-specific adenine glycosylase
MPDKSMGIDARTWFWALMDYGSYLKAKGPNHLTLSRHYRKQAPLKGSVREVRGLIVKQLVEGPADINELRGTSGDDDRFEPALQGLLRDGLITQIDERFYLTK